MSPRKRIRANPSDDISPASSAVPTPIHSQAILASKASDAPADSTMARSPANSVAPNVDENNDDTASYASFKESKDKTRSWYGSWPRAPKSSASTQVARETILGGTSKPNAIPDFSRFESQKPGEDAPNGNAGKGGPALSRKPSAWTLGRTKSNGSPLKQSSELPSVDGQVAGGSFSTDETKPQRIHAKTFETTGESSVAEAGTQLSPPVGLPPLPGAASAEPAVEVMDTAQDEGTQSTEPVSAVSRGWLSWGSRKDAPECTVKSSELSKTKNRQPSTSTVVLEEPPKDTTESLLAERPTTSGSMWAYFWPGLMQEEAETHIATKHGEAGSVDGKAASEDVIMEDAPSAPIPVPLSASSASISNTANLPAPGTATASAGSTWAFWSRDSRKVTTGKSFGSGEPGEIAIIGERSEAHPTPAAGVKMGGRPPSTRSSMKDVSVKETATKEATKNTATAANASSKKNKRLRPKSMEIENIAPVSGTPPVRTPVAVEGAGLGPSASSSQQAVQVAKPQPTLNKPPPKNLLLPTFRSTYRFKQNPPILRQITQLLLGTQQAPSNHVFLSKDLPKVKKAVAIGVHGLFPAAYLRPMIGQPTGTSLRFANHAAEAVRRWADDHGYYDCEIEKIALEGEGKIADRVENLWKLLLNWIDHIRTADVVILACHSQGVPVGFMLLAKLIDLDIVTTARIGVCAMAGVSLGPFPDYKSGLGILMGSAGELWDFANSESEVSKRYENAVKTALDYGVRVTFVGSIDDQVVPLESAIYSPVHHPYVYRAVFVDGRIHAPDFIAHLVGFACKLRNLGVSDHGLVRELSVPLAGSLYTGEGHSRLYDDPQVYDLALAHTLETANVDKPIYEVKKHEGLTSPNPYVLPWIMRGLLEEDFVKTDLHAEMTELVKQFDDWKPVTKALKDVKYRLEAVRSKL